MAKQKKVDRTPWLIKMTDNPRSQMAFNRFKNQRRKASEHPDMGIYAKKGKRRIPPKSI